MSTAVAELPDLYEVVNGQVVEKTVSIKSTVAASRLMRRISNYAEQNNLGEAFTEVLVAMPDRFEHNRRPDIVYYSYETCPKGYDFGNENAFEIVPDLCVDVISPTDTADSVREKIEEYFEAGIRAVWCMNPNRKIIECYSAPRRLVILGLTDTLRGDPVIPGFELPLAELFPAP
jgi:Uma2 family endonuclease